MPTMSENFVNFARRVAALHHKSVQAIAEILWRHA